MYRPEGILRHGACRQGAGEVRGDLPKLGDVRHQQRTAQIDEKLDKGEAMIIATLLLCLLAFWAGCRYERSRARHRQHEAFKSPSYMHDEADYK